MTTEARVLANRRNAQRSTGPRTQEGKAVVRLNAVKHGLLTQQVVLPWEEKAVFQAGLRRLHAELAPVGEVENALVENLAAAQWRLRRVPRIEAGLLYANASYMSVWSKRLREGKEDRPDMGPEMFGRVETGVLAGAFVEGEKQGEVFTRLARHETMLQRAYRLDIQTLLQLQAFRKGGAVAPPVAEGTDSVATSQTDP